MSDPSSQSRRPRWIRSSLVSENPQHRPPGTPGGRDFHSTEHLSPEAVVAFVDGEMKMAWHLRAARHLAACAACATEVAAQEAARSTLRQSGEIRIPEALMGRLSDIPTQQANGEQPGRHPASPQPGSGLPSGPSPLEPHGFPVNRAKSPVNHPDFSANTGDSKRRRRRR